MTRSGPRIDEATVRAAGGVVWRGHRDRGSGGAQRSGKRDRKGDVGRTEVVLVHRPRYDDWSLPKGKLEPDETFEAAAVREVEEETGLIVSLGAELPPVTYWDRHGRPKVVRYWTMTVVDETPFVANHEVDEVRWVPVDDARGLVTYETDRAILDAYLDRRPA